MKFVIFSLLLFLLQNCFYDLRHISRVDKTESHWTIEEKKAGKSK